MQREDTVRRTSCGKSALVACTPRFTASIVVPYGDAVPDAGPGLELPLVHQEAAHASPLRLRAHLPAPPAGASPSRARGAGGEEGRTWRQSKVSRSHTRTSLLPQLPLDDPVRSALPSPQHEPTPTWGEGVLGGVMVTG